MKNLQDVKVLQNGCIEITAPRYFAGIVCLRWTLQMQRPSKPWQAGEQRGVSSEDLVPELEVSSQGASLKYKHIGKNAPFADVSLDLNIYEEDEDLRFSAKIHNNDPVWTVVAFAFPLLSGIDASGASVLWPNGLGQRFGNLREFGRKKFDYPSGYGSMSWFALARQNTGLYFGSHDPDFSVRNVEAAVVPDSEELSLGINHMPFCQPETTWTAPAFIVAFYKGGWRQPALRYRAWHDTVARKIAYPAWVKNSSGWLLAILKQQNGDVMWDYISGIDKLCDIAEAHGLDTLGLFGWAHGGHDYLYPDYYPDPLMGGEEALKAALARAKQRGIRTVLYANGVIMDTSTDFYRYQGNDAVLLKENTEPAVSSIRKYHSSTPVTFAQACPGSEQWRARMLALARQADAFGADGILYDQIGVYGVKCCFSTKHRHTVPATAYTIERSSMIRNIADSMREVNPEFVVMTEGIHDTLLDGIAFVHGWGCGFAAAGARHNMFGGDNTFPALFRTVFPGLPMIQRHPNPCIDRHQANFAAVHGLRHEIETRYRPDVRYLSEGVMPEESDYADCAYYPPDIDLIRKNKPAEAREYLRALVAFERRYSEFLYQGEFVGDNGCCDNSGLIANVYTVSDGRLAVCVWNPGDMAQKCVLNMPGYDLIECSEPENEKPNPEAPLSAESVRIYLFKQR